MVPQHSPYILVTRDDPAIDELEDLEGRTIMVEPYSEELEAYLYHEGVDPDAINKVEHTGNPLDIYSGDVVGMTAYTTTEPYVLNRHGRSYKVSTPRWPASISTATRCTPRRPMSRHTTTR